MLLSSDKMDLRSIAKEIIRIAENCESSRYSLENANDLHVLSDMLRQHSREVYECCH